MVGAGAPQKKLSFGHCVVDNLESVTIIGLMNNAPNQTLAGFPAVRAQSALSVTEQIALRDALCDWRVNLFKRLSREEYRELVKRHTRVIADPGSSE